jgi:hypothetical protein
MNLSKHEALQKEVMDFFLLSKKSELDALGFLFRASGLVRAIRLLVHQLQLERGASTLYLVTCQAEHLAAVSRYRSQFEHDEQAFLVALHEWRGEFNDKLLSGSLYASLAVLLGALAELAGLRAQVNQLTIKPLEAIGRFNQIVERLFMVISDMADWSMDVQVSRALIALLHLMKAKELAGQERALGVLMFSQGVDATLLAEFIYKQEAQEACLDVFGEFALPSELTQYAALSAVENVAQFSLFRQKLLQSNAVSAAHLSGDMAQGVDSVLAQRWFEVATQRIDGLHLLENALIDVLLRVCAQGMQQAEQLLNSEQLFCEQWLVEYQAHSQQIAVDGLMQAHKGVSQLLFEKLQTKTHDLRLMAKQLRLAQQTLLERKLIERAKAHLMMRSNLTEGQAHQWLQARSMKEGAKLVEIAKKVLGQGVY